MTFLRGFMYALIVMILLINSADAAGVDFSTTQGFAFIVLSLLLGSLAGHDIADRTK